MSIPRFLDLPGNTCRYQLDTARGMFAVLDADTRPAGADALVGTAVLVPGLNASKEDFLAVLGPLGALGFRCVAVDLRGQYQSAGGSDEAAYHLDELAADLLAVTAALDAGPTHLVGHSLGGLVCRAAALRAPEALRSLTLLCSGPGRPGAATRERLTLLTAALASMTMPQIQQAMVELDRANGTPAPPAPIADFLRRRFLATQPAHLAALARQLLAVPDQTAALAAALAKHDVPALVACGAGDDVWSPDEQADMAARLGVRHVVIEDAAHSPAVEQPEHTARLLAEFWAAAG